MTLHPARTMPYDELWNALQHAVQEGHVYEHIGDEGLRLYCYSDETVYERRWSTITMLARGLILDVDNRKVVATPFPKFFNVGEYVTIDQGTLPALPFETFEKLDGSLIIIFHHNGKWKCSTKGSLSSDQAKWAQKWMNSYCLSSRLTIGVTYLFEAIYPENRIVVNYYNQENLVLLAAYKEDGTEYDLEELRNISCEIVARKRYYSISQLLEEAKTLPGNREGWVIRFSNGLRLKIKGDEYCRIHRLVANLTPLSIWRSMKDNEDLEAIRKSLPEEFWVDFDLMFSLLRYELNKIEDKLKLIFPIIIDLTDKEVGLGLGTLPEDIRKFIFPWRKCGYNFFLLLEGKRGRMLAYDAIRPDRNILPGYRASSSVVRAQEGE